MCFKTSLGSAFENAFSFSLNAKRILILASVNILTTVTIILSLFKTFSLLSEINSIGVSAIGFSDIITYFLVMSVIILSSILSLLLRGMFIHNYTIKDTPGNIRNSVDALEGRMLSLIFITVIIFFVSMFLSELDIIGFIASIVFAFAVIFSQQEIMIAKKGAIDSIRTSYEMFRDNWKDVLATFLISAFITILGIFLLIIPLMTLFLSDVAASNSNEISLASAMKDNLAAYILLSMLFIFVMSVLTLFSIGFITDVYLQLKNRSYEIFSKPSSDEFRLKKAVFADSKKINSSVTKKKKSVVKRKSSKKSPLRSRAIKKTQRRKK